jgi:hypothetical protein
MRTKKLLPSLAAALLATGGLSLLATPADAASVIDVDTATELKAALTAARPGDTIQLADGTYTGNFKTTVDGTSGSRITLTGSSRAVLKAGGGYGLHINGASYWSVKGTGRTDVHALAHAPAVVAGVVDT